MKKSFMASVLALLSANALAYNLEYGASVSANAGSGDFAPYYIASNNHGRVTQPYGASLELWAGRPLELDKRFSYAFYVDLMGGYASKASYLRWDAAASAWTTNRQGATPFRVQQLYATLKWRSLFLDLGVKEHASAILDNRLSSGDLVESANARAMPELRIGLLGFRDIPLTNGWVQIDVVASVAKPTDNDWVRNHYNYYAGHFTTGWWYSYKRCYFRTKPSMPFSVTVGMQAAAQAAGTTYKYRYGEPNGVHHEAFRFKTLIDMLIPHGGDNFYAGNHLGSWDFKARYRLKSGDEIAAYFQWPWEDGSGIGKLNGFDGLWGLSWHPANSGWLRGVVLEYLDFTNQSGPFHWDPADHPGSDIPAQATGFDNYYNNFQFNGYAYYGMSIGTAFLPSPLYNHNGMMEFLCNRLRGFHFGIETTRFNGFSGRLLLSWRKGWGTGELPFATPHKDFSMMAEVQWQSASLPSLTFSGQIAFDKGEIYGDNLGARLTATWTGDFNVSKLFRKQ